MKREEAAQRAVSIYEKLMALPRPDDMSNNEWAVKAGVNTSFFVNIKKGSEPSVGNLRKVLVAVGSTLPEFFADEANGRLMPTPTVEKLTAIFDELLQHAPKRIDRRSAFLAESLLNLLELPSIDLTKSPNQENPGEGDIGRSNRALSATN